jgi:hypothetical protein
MKNSANLSGRFYVFVMKNFKLSSAAVIKNDLFYAARTHVFGYCNLPHGQGFVISNMQIFVFGIILLVGRPRNGAKSDGGQFIRFSESLDGGIPPRRTAIPILGRKTKYATCPQSFGKCYIRGKKTEKTQSEKYGFKQKHAEKFILAHYFFLLSAAVEQKLCKTPPKSFFKVKDHEARKYTLLFSFCTFLRFRTKVIP